MIIETKYHGEVEIEANEIITFEHGIPGFLDEKEFILLPLEEGSPYLILQSKKTNELGFIVVNPFLFFKDYEFDLSEADEAVLKLKSENDVELYCILTIKEPFELSTANLQAPIIINSKTKLAKQVILNDQKYVTRHNIFVKTEVK
ncbi:flagellar assembly protein FliW [Metabacillus fastidiosus]|uniref:flagellar assembly protein FliW n=1 Tax=Metabacillus fastidiosus TaxID=1458 RepID=UPI002DBDA94B|nr:flagellar assembly protein FliW [Metabacillus fastidiosus]MEC2077887.1 flagellar assembly protein FliW [Metabacillus fastidiosus]